jgi:DNA repair protein SbcD/Mre11
MKYAHLADLHLGSWREQTMRDLSTNTFIKAIDSCIEKKVDFILFAGDIFNTSLPSVDTLKIVTKKLKFLKDRGIPLYVIAGSHDFSPSGKTMIDVLENAGLLINVCKGSVNPETKQLELKFTTDPKTNAKITGIIGRRGLLDRTYYENLNRPNLENEQGYKIFMFHTTLTELKPKHLEMIDSQPASFLPKKFNYYAGGHIHHKTLIHLEEYGPLTYTGALFPTNFAELEKYSYGGFYIVSLEKTNHNTQTIEWIPCKTMQHTPFILNCSGMTPAKVEEKIKEHFEHKDITNTILTLRLFGTLESGKTSDINFKKMKEQLEFQGAICILQNTTKLQSTEFSEIKISSMDPNNIEEHTINEHIGQLSLFEKDKELHLIKNLITSLNTTKQQGEKVADFEKRIFEDLDIALENT